MAKTVSIEVGPARSGKTHRFLERYRESLAGGGVGRTLWLVPTSRAAGHVREQILAGGVAACLSPGVMTFDGLSDAILAESGVRLWPLDATGQLALVGHVIADARSAGELECFPATARTDKFADLVVEHFRELKRREIEPDVFANWSGRRGRADEQRALANLYAEYQRLLNEHALTDREGRHWIARTLLEKGACRSLAQLRLVVVDGFTDFTPTQHDVLALLAKRAEELLIGLPRDVDGGRADLFAKSTATLAELKRRHPRAKTHPHSARPSGFPANDFIAANLFGNPKKRPAVSADVVASLAQLEIVAAAGQQDEIAQIARRIKRRFTEENVQPADIVVVFRRVRPAAAARVREVFAEYGIPLALESQERLMAAPSVKALLSVLRLADDDWPFRRLVALLTNNLLSALAGEPRVSAEWLVRDLQIAEGQKELIGQVESLATLAAVPELSDSLRRRADAATAALPALRLLAESLAGLPESATYEKWCAAIEGLAARLGLTALAPAAEASDDRTDDDADSLAADRAAWRAIRGQFKSLARLDMKLGKPPTLLSLHDVIGVLVDIASHEVLPRKLDTTGRVAVIGAEGARNVPIKHLYLAGMSEQAFPLPEPTGRLYTEAEYRNLSRAANAERKQIAAEGELMEAVGLTRPQEEMLLFYEVITRAQESITISYAALDEKAQAMPPSPYITEIERLFGEDNVAKRRTQPQLAQIASQESPLSPADWRLAGVEQALAGKAALLASFATDSQQSEPARAIWAGLRTIHARERRDGFSPCEGLLTSEPAAERLARRFGAEHYWSTSQWEQYATCPYKFYLSTVLGMEALGDLTLETDFGRRGGLLHSVLASFHRECQASERGESRTKEEFTQRLQELLLAEASAGARHGLDAALVELDRRKVSKWVDKHYDHLKAYTAAMGQMRPTHLELRFGKKHAGDSADHDPGSVDQAFELDLGGEKVRVTGRIDRIDVGEEDGRTVFSVIDYKSGKTPSLKAKQIESGERLQLPIYVAAAQALLFKNGEEPIAAGYWTMDRGFDQKGVLSVGHAAARSGGSADDTASDESWKEHLKTATETITRFVAGIRKGEFPVHSLDEHCTGRCEFRTVCRVAHTRALGKTWPQAPDTQSPAPSP